MPRPCFFAARKTDKVGNHGMGPESLEVAVSQEIGAPPPRPPLCPCSAIKEGSSKTICEKKPLARKMDKNSHGSSKIMKGAAKVLEGPDKLPVARMGEIAKCTGLVITGAKKTVIGGPSA